MLQKIVVFLMVVLDGARLKTLALSKPGIAVCAVALGLTATFGFAPYFYWPVTFGTLVLMNILLASVKSKKAVFFATLLYFTSLNTVTLFWLDFVMEGFGGMPLWASLGVLLLFCTFYLSLPYAIFNVIAYRICRGKIVPLLCCFIPIGYTLADYVVSYLLTGFPWMLLGYTCMQGPFSSFAPLLGVRGVTLLLVLCAGAVSLGALRRFLFLPPAALIILGGILLTDISYTKAMEAHNAALVQGNIKQEIRFDPEKINSIIATYWDLTKPQLGRHQLVVWPEAAIPLLFETARPLVDDLNTVAFDQGAQLIVGMQRHNRQLGETYNSIFKLGDSKDPQFYPVYDKQHLVPFGEFVPFKEYLRPLGKMFNIPMSDFSSSEENAHVFECGDLKLIPAICYESIFPELISRLDTEQTNAILMVSNDAWFGTTRGPLQHLAIARMRSMELQKPMLRVTNNGYTVLIDSLGKIKASLPQNEQGVLECDYYPTTGQTPYSRFGSSGVVLILLTLFIFGIYSIRHKKNAQKEAVEHLVRP
ncbi:MAG: apolipoprotein N-acyltransferase [Succinivibrio sp.]|nr:apolipoprotein N-acyltransferase [Succinivibrio sp.]